MNYTQSMTNIYTKLFIKTSRYIRQLSIIALLFSSPGISNAEEWTYTTRPGDTLWDISKKYLKSTNYWSRLQKHNNVDIAKQLSPGTRLSVPMAWLKNAAAPAFVVSVSGEVQYKKADGSDNVNLLSRQSLNINDAIATGEDGSALIQFADSSTLLILKNSRVIFSTLSSFGQTGMVDTQLRLQQGRVETFVKPLRDKNSRFEITTPAAVAAVRGTKFRVAYTENKKTMTSEVVKGAINVAAEGVNQSVNLGFGTITEQGKPPQKPVKLLQKPILTELTDTIRYLPYQFTWPALEDADQYRIQISPMNSPGTISLTGTSQQAHYNINALIDGEYIIRVRGIDKNRLEGFNAEHKFTLDTNFPVADLTAPINNIEMSRYPYEFAWTENTGVNQYQFQLSTDTDFKNIVNEQLIDANTVTFKEELPEGNYYWRVSAIDKQGHKGKYSPTGEFSISENGFEAFLIFLYMLPAFLL